MMTVPNFYRLEHNISNHNTFIDHPIDFRDDQLLLSDPPGLGVDFDVEKLEACLVYRCPGTSFAGKPRGAVRAYQRTFCARHI